MSIKRTVAWIIGAILGFWLISALPSIAESIFWPETNAPWEKVDAFYYPDRNDLSSDRRQLNVGSVETCRDWVDEQAQEFGDVDMLRGDYECGIGCKMSDGFNVCRLTVE